MQNRNEITRNKHRQILIWLNYKTMVNQSFGYVQIDKGTFQNPYAS